MGNATQRMKVVIPGGTGQVGTVLARALHQQGHDVVVLSRKPGSAPWRTVVWDAQTIGPWAEEINGATAVINLAGRSVNCRYNAENRRIIKESRVSSTHVVGEAIRRAKFSPAVWLQMSTATIYAHRFDAANDEISGVVGGQEADAPDTWRFSIDVATAWERAMDAVATPRTRKVKLRTAMMMSPDRGGVFDVLLRLVRLGLGGSSGNGLQYVSWIHDQDFVNAIYWLLEHGEVSGPVNLAAPNPLPNAEFMRALRQAWGIPFGLPAARWMLEIGAFLLRTETELVLKSRRVVPGRLSQGGFRFEHPNWPEAARDLCRRWREIHARQNGPALDFPQSRH